MKFPLFAAFLLLKRITLLPPQQKGIVSNKYYKVHYLVPFLSQLFFFSFSNMRWLLAQSESPNLEGQGATF